MVFGELEEEAMGETTRVTRRCESDNPRAAAINKAVEESGLGFPLNCTHYTSLIGKTVIVAWTQKEGDNIVERGELATTITELSALEENLEFVLVDLVTASSDEWSKRFNYDWVTKRWEIYLDDEVFEGLSVQLSLA